MCISFVPSAIDRLEIGKKAAEKCTTHTDQRGIKTRNREKDTHKPTRWSHYASVAFVKQYIFYNANKIILLFQAVSLYFDDHRRTTNREQKKTIFNTSMESRKWFSTMMVIHLCVHNMAIFRLFYRALCCCLCSFWNKYKKIF